VRWAAIALLVSCAGGGAAPVAPPRADAAIDANVVVAGDAGDAAADASIDAPSRAPLPRAFMIAYGDDEALLTRGEMARLRAVARGRFAKQTIAPVDVMSADEEAALEALAASGRMREGGPVCASPPSLERVVYARWPDARAIALDVQCRSASDCVVRTELRKWMSEGMPHWPGIDGWDVVARIAVPVGAADDAGAFERALRDAAFTPYKWEEHKRWLPTGKRTEITSTVIAGWTLLSSAGWSPPPSVADFAPERAAIEACASQSKGRFFGEIVLAADPSGGVTTCETSLPSCACAALTKHAFVAGTGTRRMRLALMRRPKGGSSLDAPPKDVRPRVGIAAPPELELESRDRVANFGVEQKMLACFAASAKPTSREVTALVELDESGRVVRVVFEKSEKGDVFTPKESACVERTLGAIPLPCPLDDASRRFRLTIDVAT